MPAIESSNAPLILSSKPGQPIGRVAACRYGSSMLVSATSKTTKGSLHLWSLPANDGIAPPTGLIRPSHSMSFDERILFNMVFPDGKVLTTLSSGETTISQTRFTDSTSDFSLTKFCSSQPFETNPTERPSFNLSSPLTCVSSNNEVAYALIDSQVTGRVSVLGLLSNQQSNVEVIQDFNYAPILGNLASSCAVRCSSTAGSPLLVIGDITGRLHFFDLRLSSVGAPIFTKAGSVKPITCIGLHPFSNETVIFGCEDGAISMMDLRLVSGETSSSAAGQTAFAAHTQTVSAMAFNPAEPDQLFSAGSDGMLLQWAWNNSQQLEPNELPSAEPILTLSGVPVNCVAVDTSRSNNSPTVIAGSDCGDVYLIS